MGFSKISADADLGGGFGISSLPANIGSGHPLVIAVVSSYILLVDIFLDFYVTPKMKGL